MAHKSSTRFGFILSSALALFGSLAAAQSSSPSGSFGFLANALTNDPSDSRGLAVVGVLNLDGAGNIAGAYTLCNRPPRTITGSVTGTYTMNSNGTGTVNLNFDVGVSLTFAAVVTDGGQGIQLVSTSGSGGINNLGGGAIVLTGSQQTLTGSIPMALFVNGASGGLNLSLKGVPSGNMTIYSASPGSSTGAIQCPDGSTGTYTANLTALTIASFLDTSGGRGDYVLAFTENGCGTTNPLLLSGQVTFGGGSFPDNFSLLLNGQGTMISATARAGQVTSLSGSYGFSLSASPIPLGQTGVMNFDGDGNVTASSTIVGPPGTGLDLGVSTTSLSGTYTVNPDGTGTITFSDAAGGTVAKFSFVTTDGGSQILLLQTSALGPASTSVASGTARMQ